MDVTGNKALNTKVMAEDVLTEADDTFAEIKGLYEENDKIYGVNSSDDDILALMETGDPDLAMDIVAEENKQADVEGDK